MDIIQLLPDSVANQIAAGEVIQRPASVIKELVENAIDAGAKHIKVLICDAGKASIQVIDDGCGMSDTDARLSFERHATSKIRQANDLFSLHTMGFRGEALASIAAVAQVTLTTRTADNEVGTRLVIAGSKVMEQEVVSCPVGSNFLIENLFFNIPARRKFLKSNATETNNITQAFERIALVYPEIEFSLYNNGAEMLMLRQSNMHQRILDVFGKKINQHLLPVDAETTLCKIKGFTGKPESAKKKGCHQYFFVNGRYMKHPYFHKAVLNAYDRLLPDGEQVSYFLYFTVNPEDIDVNIHPVKTEIKFENEQAIWQILLASVRDAVGKFTSATALDFDTEGKPDIPVFNPQNISNANIPHIDFNPQYNPFKSAGGRENSHSKNAQSWEELFPRTSQIDDGTNGLFDKLWPDDADNLHTVNNSNVISIEDISGDCSQLNAQYIITQCSAGLLVIDQNRASQRILYEKYMRTVAEHSASTQKVLFPEVIQFDPALSADMPRIIEDLHSIGFEITDLGGNNYSVSGIPSGLGGLDCAKLVTDLVTDAAEHCAAATEEVYTILAVSLARKAATPYGEILSTEELKGLLQQLLDCDSQRYTHDGKLIYTIISNDDIAQRFN
ncbi:MAG: DNA mismatch repair endonuclease MutL [Prevotella sp.]|nr:DNA mismatch repair endonuclease MutL [Prevotella sp.]